MEYILSITSLDNTGKRITRYWDRSRRMWIESKINAKGYKSAAVASGQMTRIERAGIKLPLGETLYQWGWEKV